MSGECKKKTVIEDYFGFFPRKELHEYDKRNIYVVADGMGGTKGGEIASREVVETVINLFATDCPVIDDKFVLLSDDHIGRKLEYVILSANQKLREHVLAHPELEGMGSTIVAIHFEDGKLYIGHVGDSRCYRIRNRKITRLTKDHSLVQELYETGQITWEETQTHPKRNIITRALGVADNVTCDIKIDDIQENDVFLLCSDGLSSVILDEEIKEIILQHKDNLKIICEKLISLANYNGGKDDVTVVILQISDVKGSKKKFFQRLKLFGREV